MHVWLSSTTDAMDLKWVFCVILSFTFLLSRGIMVSIHLWSLSSCPYFEGCPQLYWFHLLLSLWQGKVGTWHTLWEICCCISKGNKLVISAVAYIVLDQLCLDSLPATGSKVSFLAGFWCCSGFYLFPDRQWKVKQQKKQMEIVYVFITCQELCSFLFMTVIHHFW